MRTRAPDIRNRLLSRTAPNQRPWLDRLAPAALVVLMAGLALAVMPAPRAHPAVTAAECLLSAGEVQPQPVDDGLAAASVTVSTVTGRRGEQTGRRLELRTKRGATVSVALASESFVGEPAGDRVVYARPSAGGGSEIRALSLDTGCDSKVLEIADTVRSTLQSPADGALYIHTVVGPERRDGGVTRIDPATGEARQVLPELRPAADFGPIYGTQLAWAADGATLVVQSCGMEQCVTRIATPDGSLESHEVEQGALVGVTATDLITFAADHGRPAGLLAINRETGIARVIADDVFDARLTDASPPTLMIETSAGWQEVLP